MAEPGSMPSGNSPPRSPVHLDGRTLEGGGQLMRNALALSALTGRAVTVDRIRGNRKGKTGLRASHAAAVKFLAEISGSEVDGDRVGSQSVTFSPPTREETPCQRNDRFPISLNDVSIQPEYNIRLSTPGSAILIFQALYPYLLHVGSRAGLECIKVAITGGTNGTNSPSYDYAAQVMAPNFARLGLPPLAIVLHRRGWSAGLAGMGSINFFIHPLASPEAKAYEVNDPELSTQGAKAETEATEMGFPRINIMGHERGKITCIDITVLAPDEPFVQGKASGAPTVRSFVERQTRRAVRKALKTLDPLTFEAPSDSQSDSSSEQDTRIPIAVHTSEPTSHISRLYILIVAHTSTGFRIGQDVLLGKDINPKKGMKGKKSQKPHSKGGQHKSDADIVSDLIDECVQGFIGELADQLGPDSNHGSDTVSKRRSCLDRHMRDQIVVFEALGNIYRDETETGSQVQEDERYWTLHTQTAQWVCAKMLGSDGARGKE